MIKLTLFSLAVLSLFFNNPFVSYSQNKGKPTWLDMMRNEHNKTRLGFGIKAGEPGAILVQLFKGKFCSSDDHYVYLRTIEFSGGVENMFLSRGYAYKGGSWAPGGKQFGISYQNQIPFFWTELRKSTAQVHGGLGLLGGTRNYSLNERTMEANVLGATAFFRLSFTRGGFKMGNGYWFLSFFAEHQYYREFGENFRYWKPGAGLIFRRVR